MVDTSRRPEKLSWLAFGVSLVFLIFTAGLGGAWARSNLIYCSVIPLTIATLVGLVGAWRALLIRKEGEESEERDRVKREFDRDDLFDDRNDALKLAESSREQFDTWGVRIFTVMLFVGIIVIPGIIFGNWYGMLKVEMAATLAQRLASRNPQEAAGLSLLMMLATLIFGAYINGISREKGCRWIRPVAQWLLLSSLVFLISLVVMVVELVATRGAAASDIHKWDLYISTPLLLVYAAFGVEMFINFIIDFYRPRSRDTELQPIFESRILALITEPGGVAHNVAHALDYQFGFKVSETWFYSFVEKSFVPFVIVLAITFYLLSCFTIVDSHQMAVKLSFGQHTGKTYGPGLKVKLPWPLQTFKIYPAAKVKEITIGVQEFGEGEKHQEGPDDPMAGDATGRIIVWDRKHNKAERKFATPAIQVAGGDKVVTDKETVPVDLLSLNISLFYKIDEKNLPHYAFNYADPDTVLRQIANEQLSLYLASTDMMKMISTESGKAQAALETRIRDAVAVLAKAPERSLGVEIVRVVLVGIHPPTEIADAFQNVIVSEEEKLRIILEARRDQKVWAAEAVGEQDVILAKARSYKARRIATAKSEVDRYLVQLESYKAAPDVFRMREQLAVLIEITESSDIPRYVIATPYARRITEIIFKEKPKSLQDLDTTQDN